MARDFAFEALAEVTGTDWNTGRGELNAGLKSIREQTEVEDPYLLGDLIHTRAKMYREVMPDVMLTPTALAKHWRRVLEESAHRNRTQSTNRTVNTECQTCGGDRFVVVRLRAPSKSAWHLEHGTEPSKTEFYEEMAPCPDCNPIEITYWVEGRKFRSMDAAEARKAMAE